MLELAHPRAHRDEALGDGAHLVEGVVSLVGSERTLGHEPHRRDERRRLALWLALVAFFIVLQYGEPRRGNAGDRPALQVVVRDRLGDPGGDLPADRARDRRFQRREARPPPAEAEVACARPRGRQLLHGPDLRVHLHRDRTPRQRAGAHSGQMATEPRRCLCRERRRRLHPRAVRGGADVPRARLLAARARSAGGSRSSVPACSSVSRTAFCSPCRSSSSSAACSPGCAIETDSVVPGDAPPRHVQPRRARRPPSRCIVRFRRVGRVALVALVFLVFAPVARAGLRADLDAA